MHAGQSIVSMNHIVLAIDNSRSMDIADVNDDSDSHKGKMRRCDAVRRYAGRLLDDVLAARSGSTLLSVISFDDRARSEVYASPLSKELVARIMNRPSQPRLGTNFSECWQAIEKVVCAGKSAATAYHVIFLTDGKPGELAGGKKRMHPIGAEPDTSRYDKMEHPSAPAIVRRLARTHRNNLTIYAVGFGTDDFRWPRRLADIASAEGAHAEFILSTAKTANTTWNWTGRHGTQTSPDAANLEWPQFKRRRARLDAALEYERAVPTVKASSAVDPAASAESSIMPPPGSQQLGSSLKSVFEGITSSITSSMSMSTSDAQKDRLLRPYVPEHKDAWQQKEGWKTMVAHKLVVDLNASGERCERWVQCNVSIRPAPFARGGQQNAYHLKVGDLHCVAKESRWDEAVGEESQRLRALKLAVEETTLAIRLAQEFNQALAVKTTQDSGSHDPISITVVPVSIYRLSLRIGEQPRYMAVERFLQGRFLKANGNNGYISKAGKFAQHSTAVTKLNAIQIIPHAFTHWSFEHTTAENPETAMMVCDIQGVKLQYTDINIHSLGRKFGSTDLGEAGFEKFFHTHTCNAACRLLGLTECTAEQGYTGSTTAPASASTSTEKIALIRSKHLQSRKRQRGVDTIEIQRAIKHGRKEPGHAGTGRIKHVHNGVSVVTDATCKTGVTTYRNTRRKDLESISGCKRSDTTRQNQLPLSQRQEAQPVRASIPMHLSEAMSRRWPTGQAVCHPAITCSGCGAPARYCVCVR